MMVSVVFTVTIYVKPRPNIPNSNPPAICTGTSFIFTPTGIVPDNIQYTWTVTDNPDVDGESNVFTPTASFSQQLTNRGIEQEVVDYVVIPISDGCAGPSFNSSVTLIPNPQIDNPRRRTVCSGGDLSFTPQNITDGKVPANTLYTWTILANTNITGQTEQSIPQARITGTSLINSTLNEEDLIYNVTTSTANGCATTTFQLIVKVVPVAQINNKDLNPICSGNSFTVIPGPPNYSGDIVVPGTTYTWSFVDNPNVNGESGVFSPTSIDKISQVLTNVSNTLQTVVTVKAAPVVVATPTPNATASPAVAKPPRASASLSKRVISIYVANAGDAAVVAMIDSRPAKIGKNAVTPGKKMVRVYVGSKLILSRSFLVK
jgi:hypothetical protein